MKYEPNKQKWPSAEQRQMIKEAVSFGFFSILTVWGTIVLVLLTFKFADWAYRIIL